MLVEEDSERMSRALTVEDVKGVIEKARGGGANPVETLTGLFAGLGESATATGEVLQQALKESGVPLPEEASSVLKGVQAIEKNGDELKLALGTQLQPEVRGVQVKLGPTITCTLQIFPDGIALVGINGISVNQFIWIDVQRVQFKENDGKRSVRVDTNYGGKEFKLP